MSSEPDEAAVGIETHGPQRRRSGRRPGSTETRDAILRAARTVFAEHGYAGATMRTIAREARVDAALIHHFFVSKEGVYAAAIEDPFEVTSPVDTVAEQGGEGVGERIARGFLELWDTPATRDPMLAVVRSASSYDVAARLLRDFVTERVTTHVARTRDPVDARLRATLVGSLLVGLVLMRHVVRVEPLASADIESIARFVGPAIDRYLDGDHEISGRDSTR